MSMCRAIEFLSRGALAAFGVEHLVEVMQALVVRAKQPGSDPEFVAEVDLPLIERMCFGGETGVARCFAICVPDIQSFVEHVGGQIENNNIVG